MSWLPREFKANVGYMKPRRGEEGMKRWKEGGGKKGKKEGEGNGGEEGRREKREGKMTFALTDWADFLENTKGGFVKHRANKKVETS